MRGGRREELWALALATALHVAVVLVLRLTLEAPDSRSASEVLPTASSWEIELAETTEGSSAAPLETAALDDGAPATARARAARGGSARQGTARSDAAEGADPEPSELGASEREDEREPVANEEAGHREPISLGLGPDGWQRWVKRPSEGEATSTERAAPRANRYQVFRAQPKSTTGGLQEGLEEHDRALGLGPQGRVLSALHQAAHAGVAPDAGVARFEVTVHRSGTVEVTLGATSRPDERWRKVAAFVASNLRAKPPRIPPPRQGVKLVVELIAEQALPTGPAPTEADKAHVDVPPPKLQSSEEAKKQLERDNPALKNPTADDIIVKQDAPGVYLADKGTWGSYRLGVGTIATGDRLGIAAGPTFQGTFDPSHVGAKPQRLVRTRVIEQSLF